MVEKRTCWTDQRLDEKTRQRWIHLRVFEKWPPTNSIDSTFFGSRHLRLSVNKLSVKMVPLSMTSRPHNSIIFTSVAFSEDLLMTFRFLPPFPLLSLFSCSTWWEKLPSSDLLTHLTTSFHCRLRCAAQVHCRDVRITAASQQSPNLTLPRSFSPVHFPAPCCWLAAPSVKFHSRCSYAIMSSSLFSCCATFLIIPPSLPRECSSSSRYTLCTFFLCHGALLYHLCTEMHLGL